MSDLYIPRFFVLTQKQAEETYLPQELINECMVRLYPYDLQVWKIKMKSVHKTLGLSMSMQCTNMRCEDRHCRWIAIHNGYRPQSTSLICFGARHEYLPRLYDSTISNYRTQECVANLPLNYWHEPLYM